MNFGYDSLIGISAAFLTTLSFLPQIFKAYRTRRMEDVSRYLMILFSAGSILWIIYGISHHDLVIVGANVTAAAFNLVLLYYSFVYAQISIKKARDKV
jgi:MtN3 and saliva related transmembrane protein